jgi:hypothetical protein
MVNKFNRSQELIPARSGENATLRDARKEAGFDPNMAERKPIRTIVDMRTIPHRLGVSRSNVPLWRNFNQSFEIAYFEASKIFRRRRKKGLGRNGRGCKSRLGECRSRRG